MKSYRAWEEYLLVLGETSVDYRYTVKDIINNLDYFKKCWQDGLSCYKALEFFSFHLEE